MSQDKKNGGNILTNDLRFDFSELENKDIFIRDNLVLDKSKGDICDGQVLSSLGVYFCKSRSPKTAFLNLIDEIDLIRTISEDYTSYDAFKRGKAGSKGRKKISDIYKFYIFRVTKSYVPFEYVVDSIDYRRIFEHTRNRFPISMSKKLAAFVISLME